MTENCKYEIQNKLGQGGMSAVFKARAPITNRIVALKLLSPRDEIFEDLVGKEKLIEIFLDEARVMGAIHHDHIAEIIDCCPDCSKPYIVLDYFPHSIGLLMNDSTRVKNSRIISIETTYTYIRQALLGLERLHSAGIIHRDIKPHNLMISADDCVKIIDFGLCKIRGEERPSIPGMQVGSPFYTAPEQEKNPNDADERSDLFSIGAAAYRMLTGRLANLRTEAIAVPSQLNPGLTDGWDDLLLKSVQMSAQQRFQSAEEMRNGLEKLYADWAGKTAENNAVAAEENFCHSVEKVLRSSPCCLTSKQIRESLRLDQWLQPLTMPNIHFETVGEKTIACPAYNLRWQRQGAGYPVNWNDACCYISHLNQRKWHGSSGWRLPTVEELVILLRHPATRNTKESSSYLSPSLHWLWSSDTSNTGKTWIADIKESFFQEMDKDAMASVCAVTSTR